MALLLALTVPGISPAEGVVNGTVVPELEPWEFIVKVGGDDPEWAGCGGTLIHPMWVLTAAHCNSGLTHVHYGALQDSHLIPVAVEEVYTYPLSWTSFDLALVRLSSEITAVSPAVVGTTTPVANDKLKVAGWGSTASDGTYVIGPSVLNEGITTARDDADYLYNNEDLVYNIWAGGLEGDADACPGDSGGPLVDAFGSLVGVVSRGVSVSTVCGEGGLYADVTHPVAKGWIDSYVSPLEPDPVIETFDAAPAVAERLLDDAGVPARYRVGSVRGNHVADVADFMGPGTDFDGFQASAAGAYECAVATFLSEGVVGPKVAIALAACGPAEDNDDDASAFVTTWDTRLGDGTTVTLGLADEVDATIDWGDGTTTAATTPGPHVHEYNTDGIYTVSVTGTVTGYNSYNTSEVREDIGKLVSVVQWGTTGFTTLNSAFDGATNLLDLPTDGAGTAAVTDMSWMFFGTKSLWHLPLFDTSNVTEMQGMFMFADVRTVPEFDTSNVTNMKDMFHRATNFNDDLSGWCVEKIDVEPDNFAEGASSWDPYLPPVWSTCPA